VENKTVEMVVKDLLLADNRKKKEEEEEVLTVYYKLAFLACGHGQRLRGTGGSFPPNN